MSLSLKGAKKNVRRSDFMNCKARATILGSASSQPSRTAWKGLTQRLAHRITHIGTYFLVMDALKEMPADFEPFLVETEFWGQITDPNLMVEISAQDLSDMISALTFHVGEIQRNPYHLLLPAWMLDNVRRGAELIGGQGGVAPDFTFAALNRLRRWRGGKIEQIFDGGKLISHRANIG